MQYEKEFVSIKKHSIKLGLKIRYLTFPTISKTEHFCVLKLIFIISILSRILLFNIHAKKHNLPNKIQLITAMEFSQFSSKTVYIFLIRLPNKDTHITFLLSYKLSIKIIN